MFCPECKNELGNSIDVTENGLDIYYCENCKNRFIIDSEF